MLVPDLLGIKSLFVVFLVYFFENIFKSSIVLFKDSVLGAHIERVISLDSIQKGRVSEAIN